MEATQNVAVVGSLAMQNAVIGSQVNIPITAGNLSLASSYTSIGVDVTAIPTLYALPVDKSIYKSVTVCIYNNTNQAISFLVSTQRVLSHGDTQIETAPANYTSVAAGAQIIYSPSGYPALSAPSIGVVVNAQTGLTAPTAGTISVYFVGGALI